ncbi:MAG: type II toxin-antitoxin system prevent-host-death family antitoxin [Alphaproteobacteria bacterium]|jgi:prevent-host-death family protein|nr:type II toxin-antitoxin system prevent-host-death family antitoxin [Alphaproteobacteria bacterium]
MIVSLEDAKADLADLIDRAARGETVMIEIEGKPVARLVPLPDATKKVREPGSMKGRIWIADDFDEPMPELEKLFYGEK